MEPKPARTYHEQVALIEGKGFIVEDEDVCVDLLRRSNYYRLSGYILPFRSADGTFIEGVPLRRVQRIYEFDALMRTSLFRVIGDIEIYVRTQLAYHLGHGYGPLGYLDDATFSAKHDAETFRAKIERYMKKNERTLIVKHHMDKYDGKLPIWALVEFLSLGDLSRLYSDMRTKDQKAIARKAFSATEACVRSWLRCVTELRNRCAHHSRLYYEIFQSQPRIPKSSPLAGDVGRRLFGQVLVLKFLYPDTERWCSNVSVELEDLIAAYLPDISLEHIGFPDDWASLLRGTRHDDVV